jgi:hypothetical protein
LKLERNRIAQKKKHLKGKGLNRRIGWKILIIAKVIRREDKKKVIRRERYTDRAE